MAVGVTASTKKNQNKTPFYLSYSNKLSNDEIKNKKYTFLDKVLSVGTESDNKFFFGDNFDGLQYLLHNGFKEKISLVYIDPPFATESAFLLNQKVTEAYDDLLSGAEYIENLRQRLILIYDLLAKNGSIYLHLDKRMAFPMKLIMDEIFGEENCRAFITRKKCSTKNSTRKTYGNISDYILFYSKSSEYIWNRPYDMWIDDDVSNEYPYIDEKTGRRCKRVPIHAPGIRKGETGGLWRGKLPPKGKHWQYRPSKLDEFDAAGEIYWSKNGNPRRIIFYDNSNGIPMQDIWLNYRDSVNQNRKTTGYPTEKNNDMLKKIVEASSNPGDLILDCFAGSGSTLGASYDLGRKWIGMDKSPESFSAVMKRFTIGLENYGDFVSKKSIQTTITSCNVNCSFDIYSSKKDLQTVKKIYLNITQNKFTK